MSRPDPKVDSRRAEALFAELLERAKIWIPEWQPSQDTRDFGHALFRVAARLSSEVTERLDRTPAKTALGLLDWLGITRRAGYAARMPMVFKMANGTTDPVLAPPRVRVQVSVGDTPIAFETQEEVQLVPAPIKQMVGVDPDADAICFPPPDVLSLDPPAPGPVAWRVKSLASAQSTKLQLTPPQGLPEGTILKVKDSSLAAGGLEYRITAEPEGDIVAIDPPIGTPQSGTGTARDIAADTEVSKVVEFIPFGGSSRNLQKHALYIGADEAFHLNAPAEIILGGGASLPDDLVWQYWGKLDNADPEWHKLDRLRTQDNDLVLGFPSQADQQPAPGRTKPPSVSTESREISGRNSRWLRAERAFGHQASAPVRELSLKINCGADELCSQAKDKPPEAMPKLEGVANSTSLVLNERFYPLGKMPRQLDSFYLACEEVFSKCGAEVCIHFEMADPTLGPLEIARSSNSNEFFVYGIGKDGYLHRYFLSKESTSDNPILRYKGLTRPADQRFTAADYTKPPIVVFRDQKSISVLVWSGDTAWIWEQQSSEEKADEQWTDFGSIGYQDKNPINIKQIILLGVDKLVALANDGSLWSRTTDSASKWSEIQIARSIDSATVLKCILPIHAANQFLVYQPYIPIINVWPNYNFDLSISNQFRNVYQPRKTLSNVFLAFGSDADNAAKQFRLVFSISDSAWHLITTETAPDTSFKDPNLDLFTPLAILFGTKLLIAGRSTDPKNTDRSQGPHSLWGGWFDSISELDLISTDEVLSNVTSVVDEIEKTGRILGSQFGWVIHGPENLGDQFKTLYLLLTVRTPAEGNTPEQTRLAWWTPLDADPHLDYDEAPSRTLGLLNQAPTLPNAAVFGFSPPGTPNLTVLVPGSKRDAFVNGFPPLLRKIFDQNKVSDLKDGIKTTATFKDTDFLKLSLDIIIVKFDAASHKKVELSTDDNFYPFFEGEKIQGPQGVRYPSRSADGTASWIPNDGKLTLITGHDKVESGCALLLSYVNSSNVQTYIVCTATDDPKQQQNNGPWTVFINETLTEPSSNGSSFYSYANPKFFERYSASREEQSGASLKFLDATKPKISVNNVLVVEFKDTNNDVYYYVTTASSDINGNGVIKLAKSLPGSVPDEFFCYIYEPNNFGDDPSSYAIPFKFEGKPALFLNVSNDDKDLLKKPGLVLHFLDTSTNPKQQTVMATGEDSSGVGSARFVAVLRDQWAVDSSASNKVLKPAQPYFTVDDIKLDWLRFTADVATKPDLSWEYWNGSGWWKIAGLDDSTEDLKQTGELKFKVPTDIGATNVLGRESWWIRARLIGGDYGRESFDVTNKDNTQKVVVNIDDVHPPLALGIGIAYRLREPVMPKYLLTFDSGSWLDQSDANRTSGAIVDTFVPIAERLGQLSGASAPSSGNSAAGAKPCGCGLAAAIPTAPKLAFPPPTPWPAPAFVSGKTPPRVSATTPARNAEEVAIDTPIVVVFAVPMDSTSIDASTFQLRDADDQWVSATAAYDSDSKTATLIPNAPLAQAAVYTAIVRGDAAGFGVRTAAGEPLMADITWTFTTAASSSRAIYLAFDQEFKGSPIHILFLLEDRNHDRAMPMVVEALRNNRFEPVSAKDETRALGESGMLTLSLNSPPSRVELFGIPGFWLRLRPANSAAAADWRPRIRGAYVNAVWARAVETLEMEVLGSSDGSPLQRVALTRPPVLRDSLQLRVREPLGNEEAELLARTPGKVKRDVPGLPGCWVLWEEVADPDDAGPGERVYALDSTSGEIRFGNGEHGAIPPIGRDAIVAFQYGHGGAAAANRVPRFAPLNLVTPIAGVEAAIAPDQAAGGADPEDDRTVRRFAAARLRHRDRAVTLRDLEDLALNFSPDIAQARAFSADGGIRLVAVMGNRDPDSLLGRANPDPSQAVGRELRRHLLEHGSPALARRGVLTVVKADRVPFRVALRLRVASLDVTGSVGTAATQAVQDLFDPATGGYDGLGWRVGDSPTNDDVAARLFSIRDLDNIEAVLFSRDDASASGLDRLAVKPDQLAWLVSDGITIQFTTGT